MNLYPLVSRTIPRSLFFAIALLSINLGAISSLHAETWAEKLGYPAGKRVLILHADDIGMCYEANDAAKKQLSQGDIQSAAMMVPCPWFNEIAAWYKEHPEHDMGLHLAMNAEWKYYRWPPVAPRDQVPGLVDPEGYMWRDVLPVVGKSNGQEVETEIRAQIERARQMGIEPSHIDTHMGTLYARPDFTEAYMKVAEEYRIPAMVIEPSPRVVEKFRQRGIPQSQKLLDLLNNYSLPKLDWFDSVPNGDSYEDKCNKFYEQIRQLEPGLTELIFHPSTETEGLKHITGSWQQRSWEAIMFSDPEVKQFLEREGIIFTNWKEIMKRFDAKSAEQASK